MKQHGLVISETDYIVMSPNFHIHVSASDLYILRISQTDPGKTKIAHRYKKLGIGNEAAQSHFCEYIYLIFSTSFAALKILLGSC